MDTHDGMDVAKLLKTMKLSHENACVLLDMLFIRSFIWGKWSDSPYIYIYVYTQDFERLATLRLQYLGPANRIRKAAAWGPDPFFFCKQYVRKENYQYRLSLRARNQSFLGQ